jgi:hypothetical protein
MPEAVRENRHEAAVSAFRPTRFDDAVPKPAKSRTALEKEKERLRFGGGDTEIGTDPAETSAVPSRKPSGKCAGRSAMSGVTRRLRSLSISKQWYRRMKKSFETETEKQKQTQRLLVVTKTIEIRDCKGETTFQICVQFGGRFSFILGLAIFCSL